jgi:hypothetical protein
LQTEIEIPSWLPRRPLICQTIADLSADELDEMFGVGDNEIEFWDHFIRVLCEREALIHVSFDAVAIERILTHLARLTRTRAANVGPITLADVQNAFEAVVGQMPVEDAAVMLQRLPGLGRVKAESNDRHFIDVYILDGLRGKDVVAALKPDDNLQRVAGAGFRKREEPTAQRCNDYGLASNDPALRFRRREIGNCKQAAVRSDDVLHPRLPGSNIFPHALN